FYLQPVSSEMELPEWFYNEVDETIKDDYFVNTSLANFHSGVVLNVSENCNIEEPILINHTSLDSTKIGAFCTVIKVGSFSKVKIIEEYSSRNCSDDDYQWNNSLTLLELGEGAIVEYLTQEDHSENVFNFRNLISRQDRDSTLRNFHFYQGGFRSKMRQTLYLSGKNASLQSFGLSALSNREFIDHETEIRHRADHTTSSLIHKTVVKDKAHHIFTGNLHIPSTLSKVVASQVNHNLSLTPSARAESIPKLEIYSEDVQSSHGSTVGEIDDDQYFYLLSRGLDKDTAHHLLIEAFLTELIDELSIESRKDLIRDALKEKIWPSKK
ncbi:MAG: Fe-S cluster assembly protein SufD, partial [Leptospira sp.]|nr:Fe-S cluster assembly protein SufD [Leptospira sp.]